MSRVDSPRTANDFAIEGSVDTSVSASLASNGVDLSLLCLLLILGFPEGHAGPRRSLAAMCGAAVAQPTLPIATAMPCARNALTC